MSNLNTPFHLKTYFLLKNERYETINVSVCVLIEDFQWVVERDAECN